MATSSSTSTKTDLDIAYDLQIQETLTDSLLHPQIGPSNHPLPIDPKTLELLFNYERSQLDAELSHSEFRKTQSDLKRKIHDHSFAQEILQIPDKQWRKYGDTVEKPLPVTVSDVVGIGETFKLYFKGLVQGLVGGIGAAICDPMGNLVLEIKKPAVIGRDWEEKDLLLKVELKALIEGLNAVVSLGIKRIDFYCDNFPLYQYVTRKRLVRQDKIRTMVDQVFLLQRRFDRCEALHIQWKDVKFAFKLARGSIDSQLIKLDQPSTSKIIKETCTICLEDIDTSQMFSIDTCLHRYCLSCMKQHIEVKLLNGVVPGCPYEGCKTQLNVPSCRKILSAELIDKMSQCIAEASIPVTDKVYCPYPRCSVLMSKDEVLPYTDKVYIGDRSAIGKCIKCLNLFCINCKVPWHTNLSCSQYKATTPSSSRGDAKLKSLATTRHWRQCKKCNHMIELAEGCYHMTCRCGYEFCYTCGDEWRNKKPTCTCPIWNEQNIIRDRRPRRRLA